MKKVFLKSMLLLCALIVGSSNAWADAPADWSYTVVNGDASKLNTTAKTFTVDASHVFNYSTSTVAAGSPSVSIGQSTNYGIKFGTSGSVYYNPVILTTDAFKDYVVTKVSLYLKHNGKQPGSLTIKQGGTVVGTKSISKTSDWTTVTCSETADGTPGTLEIKYEVNQALYINKIEVWYKEPTTSISANNVSYSADVTAGEIEYNIVKPGSGTPSITATTTADWISGISVNTSTKKISFAMSTTSSKRTGTINISYKEDGEEVATKAVSVTQIKYTAYEKSTAATMVIGGTYVWYAKNGSTNKEYVAKGLGSNTYLGVVELAEYSYLDEDVLYLTEESGVQSFTFAPLSAFNKWNIYVGSDKLGMVGDKQLGTDESKTNMIWTMTGSGSDAPTFSSSYSASANVYTMFANLGASRFNGYTSSSNSTQNAILYHLATESNHTLTLDPNDGGSAATYYVKDGYSFVPYEPTRDGYIFLGWASSSSAIAPTILAEASFTMPAANTTLYAVWALAITPAYAKTTYVAPSAMDFSDVDDLKAYRVSAAAGGVVTIEEVGAVPASTPLLLIGTASTTYNVPVIASADPVGTNMLVAGDGTTEFDGSTYDYLLFSDGLFYKIGEGTIATTKAYLHCDSDPTSGGTGAPGLRIVLAENQATNIENIEANEKAVKFIENGRILIKKNGIVYDALGRIVK